MYHAPQIPIRQDWVEWHQDEFVIPAPECRAIVDGALHMSSVKSKQEYDIISCSLVDEIDPYFLSVPIPHGDLTFSFADDEMSQGEFYDEVLVRFSEGMSIEVSLVYDGHGDRDGVIRWAGYYITDIDMDIVKKTVNLRFQHEVAKLNDESVYPLPQRSYYTSVNDILIQMADTYPNINFGGLSAQHTARMRAKLEGESSLQLLTYLTNHLPAQFIMNHDGVLTGYQGNHSSLHPTSIWESELVQEGLGKEVLPVLKSRRALPFSQQYEERVVSIKGKEGSRRGGLERVNFQNSSVTVGGAGEILGIRYPDNYLIDAPDNLVDPSAYEPIRVDIKPFGLRCTGGTGGRIIAAHISFVESVDKVVPTFSLAPADKVPDIEIVHHTNESMEQTTITGTEIIPNPLGANIDACYTYPKDKYLFKLSGKMRDNPSFKPNQLVRIPYNNTWAHMFLTKTARSFTGGAWLEFEGVVVEITDEEIHPPTSFRAHLDIRYQRVPEPQGNLGYDLMVTVETIPTLSRPPLHVLPPIPRFWGTVTYPDGTSESFGSREDSGTSFQLELTGLTKEESREAQWDINMEYDGVVYSPTDITYDDSELNTMNNPVAPLAGDTVAGTHPTVTKQTARKA